jgi:transposase-like protein
MDSVNTIVCPHCNASMEPWDFIDPCDMDGEFSLDCQECGKTFEVSFKTEVKFTTRMEK